MTGTHRHHRSRWAAAAASAACAAALAVPALGAPAGTAASAAPARAVAARAVAAAAGPAPGAAATGASDITGLGAHGWRVQSSAAAGQSGARISSPGFHARGWLRVRNDAAGAPGTEAEALAQNGRCPGDRALQPVNQRMSGRHSVFFGTNLRRCYGYMNSVGPVTVTRFKVPWWWRTVFRAHLPAGHTATLIVNGVIGAAAVWLNGHRVATPATVTGAYTRFTFNVTSLVRPGRNALAIEVHPNNPQKMFTLDDVDWNQIPPDNNTGIQFPVQLAVDGALSDGNAHVTERNAAGLSSSALTVKTDITNHTAAAQSGVVSATITPPGRGTPVTVRQHVTVPPRTTRTVAFSPAAFPSLLLHHPRAWWPYQLGRQPLYRLTTSISQHGAVADATSETFGIRTVTSYLVGSSAAEPSGARAFKINGVPVLIRGGGFSPNIFLHYSAANIARQIALMKNMGVNTIRLEGHLMPPRFYQQMDRAGILVNAGFQCCDAWELQSSGLTSPADFRILRNSALAIGRSLRNHPSVFSFQWSDLNPTARQESVTLRAFQRTDMTNSSFTAPVPVISSAEYRSSKLLGPSGEKEGPYDWVPPDYWYDTRHFDTNDATQTNAGGAWGYDSEQSAGDTVPTLDSLHRFMSRRELSNLWRNPRFNQYHLNYEPDCQVGYSFGTLCHFDAALRARYGSWSGLARYVELAQAQDYENTRAQFEAYIAHAGNRPLPSTGTIYWQLNKGWPSLLWNLYNSDGDQAGSYFGAQEANRPLHALYALDTGKVTLDNLTGARQRGLSVRATVYSLRGAVLDDRAARGITLAVGQARANVLAPRVPSGGRATVHFVELVLRQHGSVIDRNVYWLPTRTDAVNWRKTLGNPQAVMSRYASLRALRALPESAVSATASTRASRGPAGANRVTTVTITNTSPSTVAFLLRADLRRGSARGGELASSLWRGNDITLFPGESQTLTVTWNSAGLHGARPVVSVSGWNVAPATYPARAWGAPAPHPARALAGPGG